MYDCESLESPITFPLVRLRCTGELDGSWLPLKQDWSKRWCTMPTIYSKERYVNRIHDFETRDSDVFVVTYMKSGTTWMQELAWLLINQLDYEGAKKSYVMERSPFLEFSGVTSTLDADSIKVCDEMLSPRLIKSHLPAQLLPRQIWQLGRKVIYVARNPKDVVVSTFHFLVGLRKLHHIDMDSFVDHFIKDRIYYASYWAHVIDFWRMRNEPNIFFVTYEEMKQDLETVIKRLCKFLDLQDVNEKEMKDLLKHLSFSNMKAGKYSNLTGLLREVQSTTEDFEFMRRGIVGSYKDELCAVHKKKLDKWTNDFLKEYDITESDIFGTI